MAKKKIGELPSGNIRVQVYDYTDPAGKKHYRSFTAASKSEAKTMAAEWKLSKREAVENISISNTVKEYIHINEPRLSPTTYKTYLGYLRYFDESFIGSVKLAELTNTDVQKFINALRKDVSGKTVRNVYQVLKPAVELKRDNFRFKVVLPPKGTAEKHLPTADDIKQTLDACNIPEMRIAIMLALQGMMRRGEISALRFEDIDFKKCTARVDKSYALTVDNVYVLKSTKTAESVRTVYLSDAVIKEIKSLKRKDGEIVQLTPNQLAKRFIRTVERAKVEPYSFHSLRHFGESTASALNIPAVYIEDIGGWRHGSDVRTRTYDHALDEDKVKYTREYLNRIDSIFL